MKMPPGDRGRSRCVSVEPGGWRGAEQPGSPVRDRQESLAKGLWTGTGTAAAADEDWNEEEVPSQGFAFAVGCAA